MTTTAIPTPTRVHVRWMIRRDLPDVLDAELLSFGHRAWGEEDVLATLREKNVIGQVAEGPGDALLGHLVYRLHKHCLEVVRLAVHPDWRGAGAGSALLSKLKSKLAPHRRRAIELLCPLDPGPCGWLARRGFVGSWDEEAGAVRFVYRLGKEDDCDGY